MIDSWPWSCDALHRYRTTEEKKIKNTDGSRLYAPNSPRLDKRERQAGNDQSPAIRRPSRRSAAAVQGGRLVGKVDHLQSQRIPPTPAGMFCVSLPTNT